MNPRPVGRNRVMCGLRRYATEESLERLDGCIRTFLTMSQLILDHEQLWAMRTNQGSAALHGSSNWCAPSSPSASRTEQPRRQLGGHRPSGTITWDQSQSRDRPYRGAQRQAEGGPEPPARHAPRHQAATQPTRAAPREHGQAVRRPARALSCGSSDALDSNLPGRTHHAHGSPALTRPGAPDWRHTCSTPSHLGRVLASPHRVSPLDKARVGTVGGHPRTRSLKLERVRTDCSRIGRDGLEPRNVSGSTSAS
ncbi:hypothetical protein QFZ76_001587 [Streptomyces sp. V4I2]|nr:hypothetical protein [Streptomyces sp. V4I2]